MRAAVALFAVFAVPVVLALGLDMRGAAAILMLMLRLPDELPVSCLRYFYDAKESRLVPRPQRWTLPVDLLNIDISDLPGQHSASAA